MILSVEHRLATYGTLVPGKVNESQLSELSGQWTTGIVYGTLVDAGWGAAHGCPGMISDPDGDEIKVHIFQSKDLPKHWDRLDAFEGDGYRRVPISVLTNDGLVDAYIYELNQ